MKGKKSTIPYWQRVEIVRNIKGVDEVIPEHCWGQKSSDIDKYSLDYIFVDKEWVEKIEYDLGFKAKDITIVPIPRTPGISSTMLKEKVKKRNK
jgi:glycerol-3-phosphate cytidylyltransferase